jgi:hypothetical protein
MDRLAALPLMFLPDLPFAAIYVVGGAMCFARWRRHPRQSRLALTAFTLFFIRLVANLSYRSWLLLGSPVHDPELGAVAGIVGLVLRDRRVGLPTTGLVWPGVPRGNRGPGRDEATDPGGSGASRSVSAQLVSDESAGR